MATFPAPEFEPKKDVNKGVVLDEPTRVYLYPDGFEVTFENVKFLKVSESGNHRLKTADGKLHIVAPGWRVITVTTRTGDWTV